VRRSPFRPLALVLVACLAVAACGGGDDPPVAVPTDTTAAPTTTTTTTTSPVPDEITVEYVQQVVDTLDDSYGDMIRRYRDDGGPTPETEGWPDLLFVEPALALVNRNLDDHIEYDFVTVADEPEGPATTVNRLVTAGPYCLYFQATRSYEPVLRRVVDVATTEVYVALAREDALQDPAGRALPPWKIGFEGRLESGEEPSDPCV
jgi:hypothetical protein